MYIYILNNILLEIIQYNFIFTLKIIIKNKTFTKKFEMNFYKIFNKLYVFHLISIISKKDRISIKWKRKHNYIWFQSKFIGSWFAAINLSTNQTIWLLFFILDLNSEKSKSIFIFLLFIYLVICIYLAIWSLDHGHLL